MGTISRSGTRVNCQDISPLTRLGADRRARCRPVVQWAYRLRPIIPTSKESDSARKGLRTGNGGESAPLWPQVAKAHGAQFFRCHACLAAEIWGPTAEVLLARRTGISLSKGWIYMPDSVAVPGTNPAIRGCAPGCARPNEFDAPLAQDYLAAWTSSSGRRCRPDAPTSSGCCGRPSRSYMRRLGREIPADYHPKWLPASIERGDVFVADEAGRIVGVAETERRSTACTSNGSPSIRRSRARGLGSWLLVRLEEVARVARRPRDVATDRRDDGAPAAALRPARLRDRPSRPAGSRQGPAHPRHHGEAALMEALGWFLWQLADSRRAFAYAGVSPATSQIRR